MIAKSEVVKLTDLQHKILAFFVTYKGCWITAIEVSKVLDVKPGGLGSTLRTLSNRRMLLRDNRMVKKKTPYGYMATVRVNYYKLAVKGKQAHEFTRDQ